MAKTYFGSVTKLIQAVFCIVVCCHQFSFSQEYNLRIGDWRAHLPYNSGIWVTQSASTVYYASQFSIFAIDKEEFSVRFISKVEGLSDTRIDKIKFNEATQTLVIIYANGNIDLLTPAGVINLNDIQKNTSIVGDRTIYDIFFAGADVYLATGFGVVKLNLERVEFEFSTFTGVPVFSTVIFEDMLYAATDEGIYQVAINEPDINMADFSQWKLLDVAEGFPPVYESRAMVVHRNQLYFDLNNELFLYEKDSLRSIMESSAGFTIKYLVAGEAGDLIIGLGCDNNCRGKVLFLKPDGTLLESGACIDRPQNAIQESNGRVWYADIFSGIRYASEAGTNCDILNFNAPGSHNSSEILLDGSTVYIAAGGVSSNGTALNRVDGLFIRENNNWRVVNRGTHPLFLEEDIDRDFYRLARHPVDGRLFVGTYWGGLIEYQPDQVRVFTQNNSTLQGAVGDEARERVAGLAFDADNNLWMTNHAAPRPIAVFTAEEEWISFDAPVSNLSQMLIDLNGYKWCIGGGGILVFDDNGTLTNESDDRYRVITPSNSVLPSPVVNCIEMDLDGNIWVGTDAGPVIFECGATVFESSCRGFQQRVEQDGFGALLLETENIQTIAVDGANRKWIGTTNGLFIQSPTGEEQIAYYNENNSPLLSNTIIDIAIEPNTGEAFIGTNNGVISLRSDATEGGRVHDSRVYAFPNPVRPEHAGVVAIKGLPRDANVKITDVSGQIVFETTANGGQAIWDGTDFSGNRVSSGVYLVFSTSTSVLLTPDAAVTKILFIK